ncbi:hypothetical protein V5O48_018967, partial [Marasmius crinis-equi]
MTDSLASAPTPTPTNIATHTPSPPSQPPVATIAAKGPLIAAEASVAEVAIPQDTETTAVSDPGDQEKTNAQAPAPTVVTPTPPAVAFSDTVKGDGDISKSNAKQKSKKSKGGHMGDSGKYVWSDEQIKYLMAKVPGYLKAKKKTEYAKEAYDELILLPVFTKPDRKSDEEWKTSIVRWYENNAKKRSITLQASGGGSAQSKSPNVKPAGDAGVTLADSAPKVRPLTRLFNKLVNGVLTLKTGREAFGEAHADLVDRTMAETNDEDYERVLSGLWDSTSPETKEHWDRVAKQQTPVLEVNEWWDASVGIADNNMMASGAEGVMSKLLDNLAEATRQLDLAALELGTNFPVDAEGNVRFLVVDTDELKASELRVMLHDWFRIHWVKSGRAGPIRYTDLFNSPAEFYDERNIPSQMKIANPIKPANPTATTQTMSSHAVLAFIAHFMEEFGIHGRSFSFKPLEASSSKDDMGKDTPRPDIGANSQEGVPNIDQSQGEGNVQEVFDNREGEGKEVLLEKHGEVQVSEVLEKDGEMLEKQEDRATKAHSSTRATAIPTGELQLNVKANGEHEQPLTSAVLPTATDQEVQPHTRSRETIGQAPSLHLVQEDELQG